jgi:hypothetical protein
MSATLTRRNRQIIENLQRSPIVSSENVLMTLRDTLVLMNVAEASRTVTLPSVSECAGVLYTIKQTHGAIGAAPTTVTITHKNDSSHWNGNIALRRPGQYAQLISDGERWHKLRVNTGAPSSPQKYIHEMFNVPFSIANGNAGGIPLGAAGSTNMLVLANGNFFVYVPKGTQTLLGPIWVNPGINIACDLTDNDGLELHHGIGANTPFQFVVGADPAFFVRCRFTIADVSGTDDCAVGFRKREANQANIDDYDEMAVLNVISGAVYSETILNNAATTATDTTETWIDGATHSLTVKVSSAGVVTYEYDDEAPATVAAFTFDNGEVVVPFFFFLHATTAPGAITILEWECGYQ